MSNLVIGDTSQLAQYFPRDYERVSSRNFNERNLKDRFYDRIYFCFSEQRTFLNGDAEFFNDVNVYYTIDLIKQLINRCNNIIVYGTSELWNQCSGPISVETEKSYTPTKYISSKMLMCDAIHGLRFDPKYDKVLIFHPYNFNSVYRKGEFLFGKVFDSIINKKKIEIDNTYYYRELLHPKFVVQRSMIANQDVLIGSGRLTFVNDFIRDLYVGCGLVYNDYVKENNDQDVSKRNINYLFSKRDLYGYQILLKTTINELKLQNKTG